MNPPRNPFAELQAWYTAQCDGEWEQAYGVFIETLPNPGWRLRVNLAWTPLDGRPFEPVEKKQKECWLMCHVDDDRWIGACDPGSLEELVLTFVDWARDSG